MNSFEQKLNPRLRIETVGLREGTGVSFCAERGGIITSIKFKDKEILYLDRKTFNDRESNVKGGIPILFPNAGPIPEYLQDNELGHLKQHGFARELMWRSEKSTHGFSESLVSNEETKKVYPYDFNLSIEGNIRQNGSLTIIQSVENTGKKIMPISMGLHPYFNVPLHEKQNVRFDFEGGDFVKENFEKWSNGQYIIFDNPATEMKIHIPFVADLGLTASKEYKKIIVWSLPERDFISIEPVMRGVGGIIHDPERVKPGEKFSAKFNINVYNNQE